MVICQICRSVELICWAANRLVLLNHHTLFRSSLEDNRVWLEICICCERLDTVFLYAFELVHTLLIFSHQAVNIILKLPNLTEFWVKTHLQFWVGLVEIFFTVGDNYGFHWDHLDVETTISRKLTLFSENHTRRSYVWVSWRLLELVIVLKNNFHLTEISNFYWTLVRFCNFIQVWFAHKRSYLVGTKFKTNRLFLLDGRRNRLRLFFTPFGFDFFLRLPLFFKKVRLRMLMVMTRHRLHILLAVVYHYFELIEFWTVISFVKKHVAAVCSVWVFVLARLLVNWQFRVHVISIIHFLL